jgi:NAD(P)-dependent dehydrogenase (short-subunit alcohol dehydrogenase family)
MPWRRNFPGRVNARVGGVILQGDAAARLRLIEEFVEAFKAKKLPLHVLVNNAGLQAPYDDTTDEGFEVVAAAQ